MRGSSRGSCDPGQHSYGIAQLQCCHQPHLLRSRASPAARAWSSTQKQCRPWCPQGNQSARWQGLLRVWDCNKIGLICFHGDIMSPRGMWCFQATVPCKTLVSSPRQGTAWVRAHLSELKDSGHISKLAPRNNSRTAELCWIRKLYSEHSEHIRTSLRWPPLSMFDALPWNDKAIEVVVVAFNTTGNRTPILWTPWQVTRIL